MNPIIVADESVDYRIIKTLREHGLTVYAICEETPSITDSEVLAIATSKNALLITEDKDFGELAFRLKLPHKGILLIRVNSEAFSKIAKTIVGHYEDMLNKFAVLNERKLRIKE